jgi:hypothetical protein
MSDPKDNFIEPVKWCSVCGDFKPVSEFYVWTRGHDGLSVFCKTHEKARHKAWRATRQGHDKQYIVNLIIRRANRIPSYAKNKDHYAKAAEAALRRLGIGVDTDQEGTK